MKEKPSVIGQHVIEIQILNKTQPDTRLNQTIIITEVEQIPMSELNKNK